MCDRDATLAAYSEGDRWGKDSGCPCSNCPNFFAVLDQAYPAKFVAILEELGIRPGQETEVYYTAHLSNGLHSFGGWFYFVGVLLSGADAWKQTSDTSWRDDFIRISDRFEYGLSAKPNWIPAPFKNKSIVTVEFQTEIPWVLSEEEPI